MPAPARPAEPTASDVPEWFARGRATREVRAAAESLPADAAEAEPKPPVARVAASYAVSFAVHLALLVTFSCVAVAVGRGSGSVSTTLGVVDGNGDEFLDARPFEIAAGSDALEPSDPLLQSVEVGGAAVELDIANPAATDSAGAATGTGQDSMSAPGTGSDGRSAMPGGGGNAVVAGSFTAWTIPEDPRPGQDYALVIEIQLPEGTKTYRREDLSGLVKGSDGYKVRIPNGMEFNGTTWGYPRRAPVFRRNGDTARIMLFVRGAERLVVDRISVASRLLHERQQLEISF